MSRAYRISLTERVERHVVLEDRVQTELELLPILSVERMAELLAAELSAVGYERDGERARRHEGDGVEIVVDLRLGQVAAKISGEAELLEEGSVSGAAKSEAKARQEAEERLEPLRDKLEARIEGRRRELQKDLSARLERRLRDLRQELDGVSNRVAAQALKEKAASLGEIEEIREDKESGSLLIRVRV